MSATLSYAASSLGSLRAGDLPQRAVRVPVRPMVRPIRSWPFLSSAFHATHKPKGPLPELESDNEDGLALPVEPDEGTVLIPEDERVVNVPS